MQFPRRLRNFYRSRTDLIIRIKLRILVSFNLD